MSDKSDEELVGDVDFDFDEPQEKIETVKRNEQQKGKPEASSKQPVKRKAVRAAVIQDDLLLAFAAAEASVKNMSKTDTSVKKKPPGKSKSDSTKMTPKQDIQEKVAKLPAKEKKQADEREVNIVEGKIDIKEECVKLPAKEKKQADECEVNIAEGKIDIKEECVKEEILEEYSNIKDVKEEKPSSHITTNVIKADSRLAHEKHCLQNKTAQVSSPRNVKSNSEQSSKTINESSKENSSTKTSHTKTENENKEAVKIKKDGRRHSSSGNNASETKALDEKSKAQAIKRKANDTSDVKHSSKQQKTDTEVSSTGSPAPNITTQYTEDDYKSMDNFLADQMLKKSKENAATKNGKYTVQVSPLEMADLAHPSMQQLILLHPTMSLTFKHQTVKFKKKKGFAEVSFVTMTQLKEFVYQLTQIKVVERRIDVIINSVDQSYTCSFVIHLNRNGKLLDLLDSGEDPLINKPMSAGENLSKIQFEKVPSTANGAFMHSMFPFTNNVVIKRTQVGRDKNAIYHGPLSVFYINSRWLEAVMDCCSDFTANGHPLRVIGDYSPDLQKRDYGKKAIVEPDERRSSRERSMDTDQCDDEDDPFSDMTLDVSADILESIQKLKELEPNNPNMKIMIQMQNHLNALQNSLRKSKSSTSVSSSESGNETSQGKKFTPSAKKQRETISWEKKLEEADRAERDKEEQMRHRREVEEKRRRESVKSRWAKNIISDFKRQGAVGERLSADAEQILRQREQRLKEKEEVEKRKKEEEIQRREEEARLRLQREQEEKHREAERKRLIEKIEEVRLRDTQKFSSTQLEWNPSTRKASGSSSSSSVGGSKMNRDEDHHYSNKRERANRDDGKFAASSNVTDDGIDDRLADFARELVQQGKIERHALPLSRPTVSADRRHSSKREEMHEDVQITEDEYQHLVSTNQIHSIPEGTLKVRIADVPNRMCPVPNCPSKTNFRTKDLFMDHWIIFHRAQTKMRFCPKCSAYFMNPDELENHIMKHHRASSKEAVELVRNARTKVIANPSYRNPYPFIPPFSLA